MFPLVGTENMFKSLLKTSLTKKTNQPPQNQAHPQQSKDFVMGKDGLALEAGDI